MPETAILLATFNAEVHLEELLDSLLAQTDRDFKVFYHDDGSADSTLDIMERYAEAEPGVFCRIPGPPTGGAKQNFMYMLGQVEADYYFFCDDDDVWRKDKVETERKAMVEAEKGADASVMQKLPAAVFCDLEVVTEDLEDISPTFFSYVDRRPSRTKLSELLIENVAPGCSLMINRALRDLAVRLTDLTLIDMHDQWVMAIASATGRITHIDRPLILYRQTMTNEVGAVHEGTADKLKRNLKDILSGEAKAKKRAFHKQAYDLARALLTVMSPCPPGAETNAAFLKKFLKTERAPKIARIHFYKKHGIDKNSGNLWYYLWL